MGLFNIDKLLSHMKNRKSKKKWMKMSPSGESPWKGEFIEYDLQNSVYRE